jgi:hypothetical protein
MHQGTVCHSGPEHRDDIGVSHPRKLMTLPGEALNVISQGFARLLPATLQVPGFARMHIHALEVAGEDLLEILQAIDDVSQQMIQSSPNRVG